jgi:hypothetical protein
LLTANCYSLLSQTLSQPGTFSRETHAQARAAIQLVKDQYLGLFRTLQEYQVPECSLAGFALEAILAA